MEPDAESSVAWILPVPWSPEYAPVPFFNTKRPLISEVVALVDLMPPLNSKHEGAVGGGDALYGRG